MKSRCTTLFRTIFSRHDCTDAKQSAFFPNLERFTENWGGMRKGLLLVLSAGLFMTSAAAKTKRKSAPRASSRQHATNKSVPAKDAAAKKTDKSDKAEVPSRAVKSKAGLCKGDSTVECWNALAVNYAKQGCLEDARQAMEAAFRTDPRLNALRSNLEAVYASLAGNAYDSALGLKSGRKAVDLALLPAGTEPRRRVARETPAVVAAAVPLLKPKEEPKAALLPAVPDTFVKVAAVEPVAKVKPAAPRDSVVKPLVKRDTVRVAPAKVAKVVAIRDTTKAAIKADTVKVALAKAARQARRDSVAASKAKGKVKPEDPKEIRRQIGEMLDRWAVAWSGKNVEGYLELYSPAFLPSNGMDRQKWEAFRRERLLAPASIEVKMESLKVEPEEEGRQAVSFLQTYKTEAVKLRSRKRLVLERIGGNWMIVAEGEAK